MQTDSNGYKRFQTDQPHHVSIQGTRGKHTTDLQSSRVPELQPCSALLTIFARIQTAIPTLNTFQKSWKETTTHASRPPARFLPPGDSNGFKRIQTDSNGYKRIQTDSNSNFPFEYVGNRFYSKTTEKITHTYLYKMYDSYRTWTCSLWVRSPTHYLLCQWALSILRPIYNNRLIYMCSQWAATHFTNKKEGAALNLPK